MDSFVDCKDHGSSAKRIKLDLSDPNIGVLCKEDGFCRFSTTIEAPIDAYEGISPDCDSGYEASTMQSMSTPSHITSPHTDPGDIQESLSNFSESFQQTPPHTDNLDTSQDSLELEPDDDNVSTASHLSHLSGISELSELSGQDWKPMAGSMLWLQKQMQNGTDPRTILSELGGNPDRIPQYLDDVTLWKLIINLLSEPPRRHKLRHVNTLDDVVRLLKGARNIIVLTGAGVSVSCGIPDFRSRDGIYSRLAIDFPDLPDPQAMFDIHYFNQDPRPFFKFARDIYPGKFQPSPCHRFIRLLERHKKLLRNYTQNIDTLEKVAHIERVIECHGSFATASCTKCSEKVTADTIRESVLSQKIPVCEKCHPQGINEIDPDDIRSKKESGESRELVASGIMKPDIVFFGEGLPDAFHEAMAEDKNQCDLLLVIGSSLKVRPVALIPSSLPPHVPQILINREPLPHCHFDVELLGDCDVIVNHLCQLMGNNWEEGVNQQEMLRETLQLLPLQTKTEEKSDETAKRQNICNCNSSTKVSSCLDVCVCGVKNKQLSIIRELSVSDSELISSDNVQCIKERHISIDSARDSGIGENSNFADADENNEETDTQPDFNQEAPPDNMKGFWQPKIKCSLADRLPRNTFYLMPPSRHIFPGAEVYYDPDERNRYFEDTSSSDSSDSESDNENRDNF